MVKIAGNQTPPAVEPFRWRNETGPVGSVSENADVTPRVTKGVERLKRFSQITAVLQESDNDKTRVDPKASRVECEMFYV